jgi:hypothetical protein
MPIWLDANQPWFQRLLVSIDIEGKLYRFQ